MMHDVDPKDDLLKKIGNLDDVEVFNNYVLVAVYLAPKRFASGLYRPDSHADEDKHQSKVGLVVKMGAVACDDPTGKWFVGVSPIKENDWVVFKPSDGWGITVNGILCRMLEDTNLRGRVQQPDQVW